MATDSRPLVPSFSIAVEPSAAGAGDASDGLDAFSDEHDVAPGVRRRLSAVAVEVIAKLAEVPACDGPVVVEADIDQGTVQVVFTRDTGSGDAVAQARARLDGVRHACDGFSVERSPAASVEVWACFSLASE